MMCEIHLYFMCGKHLFFLLLTLFHGVTSSLDLEGSRSNETKYDAFQNDMSQVENQFKSHSIRSSELPKDNGHLAFIDKLLEGYDKRAWPTYGTNQPTLVTVNIYINSLGPVSAANMDFGMDIYLRQSWVDPRLQFRKYGMNETVTLNGQDLIDKIWRPDIFFRNLKSGSFHSMTVPNKLIKLSPDGRILFSMRLTLRLSCHMSFRLYPLDAQRCWVVLGSYAMTTDQVQIQWREDTPITIEKEIEVPEFFVVLQEPGTFLRDIDTGVFSFLNVSFVFLRQNGYHLLQTYLPTYLIVMMSWVSFWVPVEAAPARTLLGATTLLTLTTVASGIRSQLPPVSYAKAIDIWIGACSVMVFSALLEFAVASYLCRMKIRHRQPKTHCLTFWKTERPDPHADGKNQVVHTPESDKKIQLRRSHAVDRYSRMIFPFVFLIFNMFYWIYYLSQRAKMEIKLL
ncbi:glycine receptor subunit alpha-2-like isoform X1 [Argiope bruennichi]|uniref:glycine receptor subunit alpha-2-like isoform X1 n=2 Tax=Argiope bruennichi TaxID=94029 RepID=UPI002494A2D5|nr:glycine receptor subunit alpha-2-like isoform X1 [Argiope bruennichi]